MFWVSWNYRWPDEILADIIWDKKEQMRHPIGPSNKLILLDSSRESPCSSLSYPFHQPNSHSETNSSINSLEYFKIIYHTKHRALVYYTWPRQLIDQSISLNILKYVLANYFFNKLSEILLNVLAHCWPLTWPCQIWVSSNNQIIKYVMTNYCFYIINKHRPTS